MRAYWNGWSQQLDTPYNEAMTAAQARKQEFYKLMLTDADRLADTVEQVLRAGRAGEAADRNVCPTCPTTSLPGRPPSKGEGLLARS